METANRRSGICEFLLSAGPYRGATLNHGAGNTLPVAFALYREPARDAEKPG